ncbi:MAG: ATP-binding cassette domain-containing protein [Candidatus Uhrbacteria bacterium]|nr:ATP-binding cassette domain-containing protein [Candidatus Uhrbacteria bacterium]
MENGLVVNQLTITRNGREILRDCSFAVAPGELLAVSGRNGAGKSTLLSSLMGYADSEIISGDMLLNGTTLIGQPMYERARRGLFLVHQEPPAIPGVSIAGAIRAQVEALRGSISIPVVQADIREACAKLGLDESFSRRPLNDGLSGGEKKRAELLQLLVLRPHFVLVDELDSGLDAAMIAIAVGIIADLRSQGVGCIVVSHSQSFIDALLPSNELKLG